MSESLLTTSSGSWHFSKANGTFEYIQKYAGIKLIITNKVFWNPNYVNADKWANEEFNKGAYTIFIETCDNSYIISRPLPTFNPNLDDYSGFIEVDTPYRDEIYGSTSLHYKCARVVIKGKATYDGESITLIS